MRRFFTVLSLTILILPIAFGEPRPILVEVAKTQIIPKVEYINAVGTLLPYERVVIRPEMSGKITEVAVKEGARVTAQEVLFRFDDRLATAQYKNATANLMNAMQNVKRLEASKGSASAQQLDAAKTAVLQAEADLEMAEVTLDRTVIKAPFNGRLGLINHFAGSYVQSGSDLTTIVNTEKLKLEFNLPERLAHTVRLNQPLQFSVDNFPKKTFTAEIYALSPEIEQAGRSLTVRAIYDNQDDALLPGMFSRIFLEIPLGYQVIMVPEEAVFSAEGKQYVYTVVPQGEQKIAKLTEVTLGDRSSYAIEVLHGLQKDDVVVKVGQAKLRDGAVIHEAL
ncbi:efflux RND transporter periplasmic adaptor subunit [Wohlfahrtiimonas chitiniclastica]|uniref:efflux RND transporter periplasmic adaptor subunit n=1 Tax=Wohlfahrtiimonas chitiniclastica TaxID=400946 RepID=UPI002157EE19|nr:efflux RND transporter periplasmic adaptor subunit [Wohlfahrtiimonas chitiniclastica]MDC7251549.1 MexH family multidrug efflux RND transporter periplasmic adaptor subunit [Wohlfahrtiimonas chitiniclastica]